MKYNILDYLSFILFISSFVLFFSGSKYGASSVFLLLSSALLGSVSLYVHNKNMENRKTSTARFVTLIIIVIPIVVIILLVLFGLTWGRGFN